MLLPAPARALATATTTPHQMSSRSNALKSKSKSNSTLSASRQQLQQQNSKQSPSNTSNSSASRQVQPKSQPSKLNATSASTSVVVVVVAGENLHANPPPPPIKVYATECAGRDGGIADTKASKPADAYPATFNEARRCIYEAAIVLRVPSVDCDARQSRFFYAHTSSTLLAPQATTTCEPLQAAVAESAPAAAPAIAAAPEMLATNQTTSRAAGALKLIMPALESSRNKKTKKTKEWKGLRGADAAENDKKYLADYKRCWPPPIFILLVTLLEITVFICDYMTTVQLSTAAPVASATVATVTQSAATLGAQTSRLEISITKTLATSDYSATSATLSSSSSSSSSSTLLSSLLIYRPDCRLQLWRFITYMFVHANWWHLCGNAVMQLVCGARLELVHGWLRVAAIYLAGVFAGSLGSSVVESQVHLMGASGGVYALLTANLANILLNYGEMRHGIGQLLQLMVFASCDLVYTLYAKYYNNKNNATTTLKIPMPTPTTATQTPPPPPTISHIAHLSGALAGFSVGLLVLRNFECSKAGMHAKLLRWLAMSVYLAFTIFAIAFNLINTLAAQEFEFELEEIVAKAEAEGNNAQE